MRKLMLAVVLGVFSQSLEGQTVQWTENIRLDRADKALDLMPAKDGFLLRRDQLEDDRLFALEHYSSDSLEMNWSRSISWPEGLSDDSRFVNLVHVSGRLTAFFQQTDRKAKKHELFARSMTPDGTWVGDLHALDVVEFEKEAERNFEVVLSLDSSAVLIAMTGPFSKTETEEYSLSAYDQNLDLKWSKRLALPISRDPQADRNFMLDHDLNAHLFLAQARGKERQEFQRNHKDKKSHVLFSYYWEGNTLKELEVAIRKRWITDARTTLTPNGLIGIAGYYSEGPYFNSEGTFCLMLDPKSRRIVVKGMVPFTPEFKAQFISEKRALRGREIPNLYLDHVRFEADSSCLIVGEIFDIQERVTADPATGRQIINYTYRYEDLLAARMNAQGKVLWTRRIPKEQAIIYEHQMYSGYALIPGDSSVTFLYNDHADNLLADPNPRTLVSLRKVALVGVELGMDGSLVRRNLMDQSGEEIIYRPELFRTMPNGAVLFAQYKRNYRLGLLDLNPRVDSVIKPE